jgi:hypothetical protein
VRAAASAPAGLTAASEWAAFVNAGVPAARPATLADGPRRHASAQDPDLGLDAGPPLSPRVQRFWSADADLEYDVMAEASRCGHGSAAPTPRATGPVAPLLQPRCSLSSSYSDTGSLSACEACATPESPLSPPDDSLCSSSPASSISGDPAAGGHPARALRASCVSVSSLLNAATAVAAKQEASEPLSGVAINQVVEAVDAVASVMMEGLPILPGLVRG